MLNRNLIEPITETGCHIWMGPISAAGYGLAPSGVRRSGGAHRMSYEEVHGKVPDGMYVCHKCDVRLCVNPDHLYAGHPHQNTQDMVDRGRQRNGKENYVDTRTHCSNGHELTDFYTSSKGLRMCRPCRARAARDFRERKSHANT